MSVLWTGQAGGPRVLRQRSPRRPLCGAARSAASSGRGISALRLVRSVVRSCAMLAKSVFVLKPKVSCPQLPPSVLFGQKIGQDRNLVKKVNIWKVLRIGLPIVENLSGLQENIFSLSRGPQLHFGKKSKKILNFTKLTNFRPFPLFGVPWAAVTVKLRKVLALGKPLLQSFQFCSSSPSGNGLMKTTGQRSSA